MALEIAFYKVTEDIAIRSGLIAERYRTADNKHWILDNKDLSRVRFTADEYINGLSGKINETISQEDTGNVEEVIGGGDDEIENEANV